MGFKIAVGAAKSFGRPTETVVEEIVGRTVVLKETKQIVDEVWRRYDCDEVWASEYRSFVCLFNWQFVEASLSRPPLLQHDAGFFMSCSITSAYGFVSIKGGKVVRQRYADAIGHVIDIGEVTRTELEALRGTANGSGFLDDFEGMDAEEIEEIRGTFPSNIGTDEFASELLKVWSDPTRTFVDDTEEEWDHYMLGEEVVSAMMLGLLGVGIAVGDCEVFEQAPVFQVI